MTIKQVKTGWQVDIQPGGRVGKRVRKTLKTKAEALAWERHFQAKAQQSEEWQPAKKDLRKLTELCDLWYKNHGAGLRAGAGTYRRLLAMCEAMGNPRAEAFSAEVFTEYRTRRLHEGLTANNMNREHAYLRAMFNELIRLGLWKKANPLENLRAFKIQEIELAYLRGDEIEKLLSALGTSRNPHVKLITKICLSTGARWSEAEELTKQQVRGQKIEFARTKSGKVRAVPISKALAEEITEHAVKFPLLNRFFEYSISAFREGVVRAGIALPDGQMTHVLRHTFASHFMMNGGNILALQRILGHANLTMTMRYAHLAPEHLLEAVRLNPLSALTHC